MKIKLSSIVILIILLILGIIGIITYQKVKENAYAQNTLAQSNSTANQESNTERNEVNPPSEIGASQGDVKLLDSDLDINFLKMESNKQNLIYSPLSIKYALKMLSEGAKGNTKIQIDNVVGRFNLTKYRNIENKLSLANSIFIRDKYSKSINENYKNIIEQQYQAEIKEDSFENVNNINQWIENKTLGIIKNMLQPSDITENTIMALINALAIDMKWENQFNMEDTYGDNFYLEDGKTLIATMMNLKTSSDSVSYYKDENVTALSMNLEKLDDTQLEFTAIMPNSNLKEYINTVKLEDINNIMNNVISASKTENGVKISIPKFSFDYDLKFKEDLERLGITDAFNPAKADFSNMNYMPLFVSRALHKAKIDFTEKGVKAAAVTVFSMDLESIFIQEKQPIEIKIDKPFLFFIRDKQTGEIWFTGTVYEPNSWEVDKAEYLK